MDEPYHLVPVEMKDGESVVFLNGHDLLGEEGSSGWTWHLGDGMGSVRQLGTEGGSVSLAQGYTPFGVPMWSEGSATSVYGFTGEQWQADARLLFLRAWYYQPATGRFLSRDPFPGFAFAPTIQQPHAYVGNNPVRFRERQVMAATVHVGRTTTRWLH